MNSAVTSSEKLSVAALISVILRRKVNRTIDVKWLIENDEYAKKVIELCREQAMPDLNEYADHLEFLTFGKPAGVAKAEQKAKAAPAKPVTQEDFADTINESEENASVTSMDQNKYVGRLR